MQKESTEKELQKLKTKRLNVLLMIGYAKCRLDKMKTNRNEIYAWLLIANTKKLSVEMKTRISETRV